MAATRRHGAHAKFNPLGHDIPLDFASQKAHNREGIYYRAAVVAACDRALKDQEFRAQHGPVRILMKDGKPTGPSGAIATP